MVGKISTGNFFGGVIDYAKDKNKARRIDSNMMSNSNKDLKKEFLLCANLNTRTKKKVKHLIISFSESDKTKLNDNILQNITQEYLKDLGFVNNQYVAYLHSDTSKEHLHIIVNRIDYDGKVVKDSYDKMKSRASLMKLEEKYNLTRTKKISLDKMKNYDKNEKEMSERMKKSGKLTDKQKLNNTIIKILESDVRTEKKFSELLHSKNIKLIKNTAGNGYSFEFNERNYKASTVNRNLSFAKINQIFNENTRVFNQQQREENNFKGLER